jgi:dihydroneopterin aldolase
MKPDLDTITLSGMSFHTRIGVLPHEREIAQPLEVDLTAWIARDGGVVDYRRLYDAVRVAASAPELLYLEDLAESIAAGVLGHDGVFRVRIAVRKPHAAVGGPLRFAQVELVRQRDA